MPLIDNNSPTLTSAEAEAYLRQTIRARVTAVKTISELEEAKAAEIPDATWVDAVKIWQRQYHGKSAYQSGSVSTGG